MPKFKEIGEVPEVGHSTTEEHFGQNTTRFDFNAFIKGRLTPVSIEHNMRSGFVTLDVCGKPKKSWQVKSLAEAFSVPFNFQHEGHKFTVRKEVDSEGDETERLELLIDGVVFNKHPYIDINFGKLEPKISLIEFLAFLCLLSLFALLVLEDEE